MDNELILNFFNIPELSVEALNDYEIVYKWSDGEDVPVAKRLHHADSTEWIGTLEEVKALALELFEEKIYQHGGQIIISLGGKVVTSYVVCDRLSGKTDADVPPDYNPEYGWINDYNNFAF